MGATERGPGVPHWATLTRERDGQAILDGAIGGSGRVIGTYVHGLFENDVFRAAIIRTLAARRGLALDAATTWTPDAEYDRLANALESSLDTNRLRQIVGI